MEQGKITRRGLLLGAAAAAAASSVVVRSAADPDDDAGPALDAILAEVARARSSLKTLEGPFTQERLIGLLKTKVRSTGTLTLVRPDRLRWELASPDDVTYWMTPAGLAYKSRNGQGSVSGTTARLASALEDMRTLLGGDLSALRKHHDLKLVSRTPAEVSFEATPIAGDAGRPLLQRIAFVLAGDLVRPLRATLVESAKDKTEITFGTLAKDVDVDPAKMSPP